MKNCIIIPARFNSKRIPGKPLLEIKGKPLIIKTIEKLKKKINLEHIYVCTDDRKVAEVVDQKIISKSIIVKKYCLNGTERCSWALKKIKKKYDYVTIVSCDMPFIEADVIKNIENKFKIQKKDTDGVTVHCKINDKRILKETSIAKITVTKSNRVLYITRSGIPYSKKFVKNKFFSHHGIMMLKWNVLKKYKNHQNTSLQILEDNEWLKLIENDYVLRSYEYKKLKPEINTEKDIKKYFPIKVK